MNTYRAKSDGYLGKKKGGFIPAGSVFPSDGECPKWAVPVAVPAAPEAPEAPVKGRGKKKDAAPEAPEAAPEGAPTGDQDVLG